MSEQLFMCANHTFSLCICVCCSACKIELSSFTGDAISRLVDHLNSE